MPDVNACLWERGWTIFRVLLTRVIKDNIVIKDVGMRFPGRLTGVELAGASKSVRIIVVFQAFLLFYWIRIMGSPA